MSYSDSAILAIDPNFIARVEVAIVERAILVIQEIDTTANHANRVRHANAVVRNPSGWAKIMVWGVVSSLSITALSSDTIIATQVSGIWNTYSQEGAHEN